MARFLIVILTMMVFLSESTFAGEKQEGNQQPQSIETINKNEARENVSKHLGELAKLLMEAAQKKYYDCLKAFGNHDFCQCVRDKTPSGINFAEYVTIVITSKDKLGYSKADEETKGIIDNTLKAREACVGSNK